MQTTYGQQLLGNRTNTNQKVIEEANRIIENEGSQQEIIKISDYYEKQTMKLLIEIINARSNDITGQIVIRENSMQLIEHEVKRHGRPKFNWYLEAIEKYWNFIKTKHKIEYRYTAFDIQSQEQTNIIFQAAAKGWCI